jgi:hypothetical protein
VGLGNEFVMDDGGKITGNVTPTGAGGAVQVIGGVLTMNDGSEISGNGASTTEWRDGGGGVYVNDNGAFIMNGGVISGNTSIDWGGGVVIQTGSTFTMNGGTISGNYTEDSGGGVWVKGEFTMSGNAKISKNKANYELLGGGGVCVSDGGKFTMSGNSEISENLVSENHSWAGGVLIHGSSAEFYMISGSIVNNSAPDPLQNQRRYTNNYFATGGPINIWPSGTKAYVSTSDEKPNTLAPSVSNDSSSPPVDGSTDVTIGDRCAPEFSETGNVGYNLWAELVE